MKNLYLAGIFLLLTSTATAQNVQWASKVIKCSSDLGGKQNGIKRILGKPDAFPQGGSSANAWTPKDALDGLETVVVGFEKPQTVKQVAVFENLNSGCVSRIMADTGSGKFETVWVRQRDWKTPPYVSTINADRAYYYNRKRRKVQKAPDVAANAGVEYAILDNAVYNAVAIKIEFNFAIIPGQKQIDAIGISDSAEPIKALINSLAELEQLAEAQHIDVGDLQPSNPCVSDDGSKLYFTSTTSDKETVYSCNIINGVVSAPIPEDESLNGNPNYNYIESINGNIVLKGGVPYSRGTGECGYEIGILNNGKYESQSLLKITAFHNYDDTSEAVITSDGKIIIIGIESDLSQGGADLYVATRKEDGTFMFLQNMGKVLNSAADESMPCLLSDQKTLIFSSNGFSGHGDYDFYVSHRLDDSWKNWSEPINLGSSINSGSFDGLPSYDERNETLYFTRSENGNNVLLFSKLAKSLLTQN
ncbi:MAG TPA: hypothetical protein VF581_00300 [Flavobacterium sp.]|jgi:hypothetical protein